MKNVIRFVKRFFLPAFFSFASFLVTSLLLIGFASAQSQTPIFPITPEIGSPTSFSVLADFNGDGKLDLAFLGSVTPGLSVTLDVGGNAPTTINTPVCSSLGGPGQFAVGDVNHDKKPDIVMACTGYIVVLLGNGDGTFQAPVYYPAQTYQPVLVDLNGDGYLDLAAVTNNTALTVFLNEGSAAPGTFGAAKNYSLGTISVPPYGPVSGDFNGDGKQDLLVVTGTGLIVFYGNGDGTLQAPQAQPLPSTPSMAVAVGDFNHDGITDVAYTSVGNCCAPVVPANVQIFLGNSSGVFTQGATLPIEASSSIVYLAAAQLSTNGNLDLIATGNGITTVFRGDGKGGFSQGFSYAASGVALIGDLNGDGKLDLLLQDYTSMTPTGAGFFLLYGNGDGTFQGVPTTPTSTNGNVVYADLNGDGIADAVYEVPAQNATGASSLVSALGRGDGSFVILDQTVPLSGGSSLTNSDFNGSSLTLGDFNGDGKPDLAAVTGNHACPAPTGNNGILAIYPGNGDGTFKTAISVTGLPSYVSAFAPVTGDFNGDGKLDLVIPYGYSCTDEYPAASPGLIFLPGNGDGTFGTPVYFSPNVFGANLLVGDLNKDGKLDLIWQGVITEPGSSGSSTVYLGNGDGTFKQMPLNLPSSYPQHVALMALTDLNGDGYPDLAVLVTGYPENLAIYAGKGDGTFQTSPFYTVPLPQGAQVISVSVGGVNRDGHPDIVVMYSSSEPAGGAQVLVFLGDGKGNFTADTNTYFAGIPNNGLVGANTEYSSSSVLARLNNQAPTLANDSALDILANTSLGLTSLLNQNNPAPSTPAPFASATTLQASAASGNVNAQITLTATVSGANPTGSVSFAAGSNALGTANLMNGTATLQTSFASAGSYSVKANYQGDSNNAGSTSNAVTIVVAPVASVTTLQASTTNGNVNAQITLTATVSGVNPTGSVSFAAGGTALGTATLTNGTATLQTSFASAGSYSVTANYQGDSNNTGSTSDAVTIVVVAPDFTVTAQPSSATITAGQSATFTFTVTPVGGYSGTVKFSCGMLPSEATCSFSPATVTPSSGSAVTSTLTITTTAAMASLGTDSGHPNVPWIPGGTLAMAGLLGIAFIPRKARRWNHGLQALSLVFLLAAGWLLLQGCGGGGNNTPTNPGTPQGSDTVSVIVADSGSGPQHSVTVDLTVQ